MVSLNFHDLFVKSKKIDVHNFKVFMLLRYQELIHFIMYIKFKLLLISRARKYDGLEYDTL